MSGQNSGLKINVVIADDQPLVVESVERLLSTMSDVGSARIVDTVDALFDHLRQHACHLVIIDPAIAAGPGVTPKGLALLRKLRIHYPAVLLIVLTAETSADLLQNVVELGVTGLVSTRDDASSLADAIERALERHCFLGPAVCSRIYGSVHWRDDPQAVGQRLSKRELEVLVDYTAGLAVIEIAARHGRSIKTISAQKCAAMRKLAIHTDVDLFNWWAKVGKLVEAETSGTSGTSETMEATERPSPVEA
jgi:two-component system, NarL family, captular synthesis response regulator RcsB